MTGNAVTFPLLLLLYISGRPSLLKIIDRKENKKTIQQGITVVLSFCSLCGQ
jgi:hypothetical protein